MDLLDVSRHSPYRDAAPYSFSDLTGFATLGATYRSGSWIFVHDGGGTGKVWTKIAWNPASQPSNTGVTVEVRAADTITGVPSTAFAAVSDDVQFSGVTGRYLEVRVTLWREVGISQTPALTDLTVRCPQ